MLAYKVNKSAVLQELERPYVAVAPSSPLDTEELVCQPVRDIGWVMLCIRLG